MAGVADPGGARAVARTGLTRSALALRYAAFAVLATVANLGVQRGVIAAIGGTDGFVVAVLAGTAAGLALKYLLDKRWIFDDRSTGIAAHGRRFTLYTAAGIVTTLIFWATETAFWLAWGTPAMRELGALIGLGIGYVVKYRLDRRFVFTASAPG